MKAKFNLKQLDELTPKKAITAPMATMTSG